MTYPQPEKAPRAEQSLLGFHHIIEDKSYDAAFKLRNQNELDRGQNDCLKEGPGTDGNFEGVAGEV